MGEDVMKKLLFFMVAVMLLSVAPAWAALLDLTAAGASGTINGGYFLQVPDQSTGTGVIEPFVRIQANGTEQGYNTSNNAVPFDEKTGIWTHDLLLSAVPTKDIGGTIYREFLLDINQTRGGTFLSLDELQIYRGSTTSPNTTNVGSLGTLVYDLDIGVDGESYIKLNYLLNPGSGAGDMFAYIPETAFAGAGPNDYVYLYSLFGSNFPSDDGFEEWAIVGTSVPVPIPAAAWLLGSGLLGLVAIRRRVKK